MRDNVKEAMFHALCVLSPKPAPVPGRIRVLLVHSQPLERGEKPVMREVEDIAYKLDLHHKEMIEPYHAGYVSKPHEEQITRRILDMLRYHRLHDRFQCDRFNYTFSQDTIAIGLAEGRPSRIYNTWTASLLLYIDYHPDNLSAIEKNSPEAYTMMAMDYVKMVRLGAQYTELPTNDAFPGVTIMSNLLPAAIEDQFLPPAHIEELGPMTSSKSKGPKAVLSKAPTGSSFTWQQPDSLQATSSYNPPVPPPPPMRNSSQSHLMLMDEPIAPMVPPPPQPQKGHESQTYHATPKPSTWKPSAPIQASWNLRGQHEWRAHASQRYHG